MNGFLFFISINWPLLLMLSLLLLIAGAAVLSTRRRGIETQEELYMIRKTEKWHSLSGTRPPLHEYLGITWEEWTTWAQRGTIPESVYRMVAADNQEIEEGAA